MRAPTWARTRIRTPRRAVTTVCAVAGVSLLVGLATVFGLGALSASAAFGPRVRDNPRRLPLDGRIGCCCRRRRPRLAHAVFRSPRAGRHSDARIHHQRRGRPARSLHDPRRRPVVPVHVAGQGSPERAGALGHRGRPMGRAHRCASRRPCVGHSGRHVGARRRPVRLPLRLVLHFATGRCVPANHVHRRRHQHRRRGSVPRGAGAVHLPAVTRGLHRPACVRGRRRPALHGVEVGPERPLGHSQHADLQSTAQRRWAPPAGAADGDLRSRRALAGSHRRGTPTRTGARRLLPVLFRRLVQSARIFHRRGPL